jgi:orotate phosphoribosyltransferase
MSTPRARLLELLNHRAVIRQKVTLASGQTSDYYIDCRSVLLHGEAATLIGELFYDAIADLKVEAVGGPETAALPITTATVMAAYRRGVSLEGFFVRKETKAHGLQKRIEGRLQPGWRVAVVEDVLTTGGSVQSALQAIQEAGGQMVRVVCLVDRLQGAAEKFAALGIPFQPIFTLRDLTI